MWEAPWRHVPPVREAEGPSAEGLAVEAEAPGNMIGIFDSGSGGLTVLRTLRACAPMADVVYFGDLAHAPYGNRERRELNELTVAGIQRLIQESATEIVSACNSVSLSVVEPWFKTLDVPYANVIEMVGPTTASLQGITGKVLVVATHATIESGVYEQGLAEYGVASLGVALPYLVDCIERDEAHGTITDMIEKELEPHLKGEYTHLVLGCTHFPIVKGAFEEVLNRRSLTMHIVDPAIPVSAVACERFSTAGRGQTRCILSRQSDVFETYMRHFFPDMSFTLEIQEDEQYE